MALKNFSQFTPQTVLSATDFVVGYRTTDEIRTDLNSLTDAISGILISKGFTPGGALGTVKRVNYRYTIDLGENLNAVSGADDYGLFLTYTPNQLDVYRNGVHLVDGQDYLANNTTQVTNLSTMNTGDVIDIVTLSAAGFTIALSGSGSIFTNHYRYTVPVNSVTLGSVNVVGPDDLGNTLQYSSPNLEVYLNGSHLVYGLDYTALNGSTITMVEGLSSGDVVDVSVISAYNIGGMATLSTGVFKLRPGPGIILNPANGVGDVTITGNTLALTGGNITIPVGSTRTYKNVQSALNSLTAFIFEDTANVQILLDDETFNETTSINLGHDYGDRITIRGQGDYNFKSLMGSPVLNVSGVNVQVLSAEIALDPSSNVPAVDDYISIYAVSGREVGNMNYMIGVSANNNIFDVYQYLTPTELNFRRSGNNEFYARIGDRLLVTYLSAGNGVDTTSKTSQVLTITQIELVPNDPAYGQPSMRLRCSGPVTNIPELGYSSHSRIMIQIGNPDSHRGTTFTQVTAFNFVDPVPMYLQYEWNANGLGFPNTSNNQLSANIQAVLSFSDTGVATNTYLNPGDVIHALGQMRVVEAVSSNNRCFINAPFKTSSTGLSGYNRDQGYAITTPTPFLIKTCYERYRGCHRVAAVNGSSSVTIEVPDSGFMTPFMAYRRVTLQNTASLSPISGFPLPRYGIRSIGNAFSYEGRASNGTLMRNYNPFSQIINYPQSKILKTKLNFSNATSPFLPLTGTTIGEGMPCLYLNGSRLRMIDNLVVLNSGLDKQTAFSVGRSPDPTELPTRSTITIGNSGIGIVGKFQYHLYGTNSVITTNSLGLGVYDPGLINQQEFLTAYLPGAKSVVVYLDKDCVGNHSYYTSSGGWYSDHKIVNGQHISICNAAIVGVNASSIYTDFTIYYLTALSRFDGYPYQSAVGSENGKIRNAFIANFSGSSNHYAQQVYGDFRNVDVHVALGFIRIAGGYFYNTFSSFGITWFLEGNVTTIYASNFCTLWCTPQGYYDVTLSMPSNDPLNGWQRFFFMHYGFRPPSRNNQFTTGSTTVFFGMETVIFLPNGGSLLKTIVNSSAVACKSTESGLFSPTNFTANYIALNQVWPAGFTNVLDVSSGNMYQRAYNVP